MEPTKDETHAIVEFVDVLLREGAVIQADVIVTVADIPLIGISLRAAIAGMTTMTDYGMFEEWDAAHRQRQGEAFTTSSRAGQREE
ncbi:gas vesicle protein GvpM [Halopenitus persicus]|uniref:Gas vesicle protein n=1 Tax=Halopenitus persicus TaxID=1048396 RepID=A0A1H3LP57_9EURY|nr:gas vesicle protein [Halopenitus persicus]SDY65635.1 Gas vesicle protein [Halopenitus persicus]